MNLDELRLSHCAITDEGLQTLAEGAANHSKDLDLTGNDSITVSGLKYLSTSLQSDSCLLEIYTSVSVLLLTKGCKLWLRGQRVNAKISI